MKEYYLAIDIGASSGRHMIGWLENNIIHIEEVYRFENQIQHHNGELLWDTNYLFQKMTVLL